MKKIISLFLLTVTIGFVLEPNIQAGSPETNSHYSISSKLIYVPAAPPSPTVVNNCGSSVLTEASSTDGSLYFWEGTNSSGTDQSKGANIPYTVTVSGTYYVRSFGNGGWGGSKGISVTVKSLPAIPTATNGYRCGSGQVTLTASCTTTGAILNWYNLNTLLATGSSYSPTVSSPTAYQVRSSLNGCENSTEANVTAVINPIPTAFISPTGSSAHTCINQSLQLNGNPSGGTLPYTHLWTGPVSNTTIVNPVLNESIASVYPFTYTVKDANNCTATVSENIAVNSLPSISATASPTSVCPGGTSTLTASGGSTYSWSNGLGTRASVTATLGSSTTTYQVTGTDGNACSNTANVTVTVKPLPAIPTATNGYRCGSGQVTLTASCTTTGAILNWYNLNTLLATGSSYSPTVSSPTAYQVRSSLNGCENSTEANVTAVINPIPTAFISPTGSSVHTCINQSLQLNGNPSGGTLPYTHLWTGPVSNTTIVNPVLNESIASVYPFTYTVKDANNCTATVSENIAVNSLPSISATASPTSVCPGGTSTLTASGGSTYSWSNGLGTGASVTATLGSSTTTYQVTGTDGNACSNTANVTVTIKPLPAIPTATNGYRCGSGQVTLTASCTTTGAILNWYNLNTLLATGSSYSPTVSSPTAYQVRSSLNGCENSTEANVTAVINPIPTAFISPTGSSAHTCINQSLQLNGNPSGGTLPYTHLWTGPVSNTTIVNPVLNESIASVYPFTYTVKDANNCTATVSENIAVNSLPSISATASPTSVCPGGTSTLTASGGSTYSWSNGLGTRASVTATLGSSTTTYQVTGTDGNACSNTANVTVTVKPLPAIPTATNGYRCGSGQVTLTASCTTTGAILNWYNLNTLLATGSSYSPTVSSPTAYQVRSSLNGCENSTEANVTAVINPIPTAFISPTGSSAHTCINQSLQLNGNPSGGTLPYTHLWTGPVSNTTIVNPVLNESIASVYPFTYTVKDANNCTATVSENIAVNSLPTITASATPSVVGLNGQSTLTASGSSTSYSWNNNLGNGATVLATIGNSTTTYQVTGTDGNGCTNSANVTVNVDPSYITYYTPNLTSSNNYIYTTIPRIAVTDLVKLKFTTTSQVSEQVDYFDGLGRPLQSINMHASPIGNDIVTPHVYDNVGREAFNYLPFTYSNGGTGNITPGSFVGNPADMTNTTNPVTYQAAFYNSQFPGEGTNAVLEKVFDNSPLNRVIEQGAPGSTWQIPTGTVVGPNETYHGYLQYATLKSLGEPTGNYPGHTTIVDFSANTASEVHKLYIDADGNSLRTDGTFYNAGTLYKTTIKNENWSTTQTNLTANTTCEFKDIDGRVILKRAFDDAGTALETYYVYDDFGLLRYVLPPVASTSIIASGAATYNNSSTIIKAVCYYYEYDGRKRMALKQLPGADPVKMIYDYRDRLVATQDGNLRDPNGDGNTNDALWMFTKYDNLNRPVLTGTNSFGLDEQTTIQAAFDAEPARLSESMSGSDYTLNNSFPSHYSIVATDLLSKTYYDNYNYANAFGFDAANKISDYSDNDGTSNGYFDYLLNKPTGNAELVLDGTKSNWLYSSEFYDDHYRVIQTQRTLYDGSIGGTETINNKFDFIGELLHSRESQTFNTVSTTVDKYLTYDHAGRLINTQQQINGDVNNGMVNTSNLTYNELGQLADKKLNGNLQSMDYWYNIRGWLTSINNPDNLANDGTRDIYPDLFAEKLLYNDNSLISGNITSTNQYNGNISGIIINRENDASLTGSTKSAYGFTYDALNRLTNAYYAENTSGNYNVNSDFFNESGISYDKNGNIQTLQRKKAGTLIDNLSYTYINSGISNQLQAVMDASLNADGFSDVTGGTDYIYDKNGNLTKDANKTITKISYNILNLPNIVAKDANNGVTYTYSASGEKLMAAVNTSGTPNNRYYAGAFEYDNTKTFSLMKMEEGIVTKPTGQYVYEYQLKDHLGNVRITFSQGANGPALNQRTDYYPFGMVSGQVSSSTGNNYLYNGKESQKNLTGIDWDDYGARFYDPQIGRFTTQDAYAEKYKRWSPYTSCKDNPIKFVDIKGDSLAMFLNGTFFKTYDNGKKETTGYNQNYTVDKDGKKTFTSGQGFAFNDPEHDAQAIRNGEITTVSFVSDKQIDSRMNESGVNKDQVCPMAYALKESLPGGKMDFAGSSFFTSLEIKKSSFYVVNGNAYNSGDIGNFLWGHAMNRLGVELWLSKFGAQVNSVLSGRIQNANGTFDYGPGTFKDPGFLELDSPDDQRAIKAGYLYRTATFPEDDD